MGSITLHSHLPFGRWGSPNTVYTIRILQILIQTDNIYVILAWRPDYITYIFSAAYILDVSRNIALLKNKNLLGGFKTNGRITLRRKNMLKKMKPIFILTLPFILIMFFFGFEPQINACSLRHKAPDYTYSQYMDGSIRANGDSIFVRVLTTIAYPGAKAGRLVRNAVAD